MEQANQAQTIEENIAKKFNTFNHKRKQMGCTSVLSIV